MKKLILKKLGACLPLGMGFILTAMLFSSNANAQNVNIPDSVFKAKLVNNTSINTNGDAEIQVTEAAAFTGIMNVARLLVTPPSGPSYVIGTAITDLTGVEAFTALTGLNCSRNSLSSLNVSTNTSLTMLNCSFNQLTNLNVSANTSLTDFNCSANTLTSIDVSANTALTDFTCYVNQLTSLDVSSNTALTYLECSYNQLTSLDVSINTALSILKCAGNQLTSLNLSTNIALTILDLQSNQLSALDVSSNTDLTLLKCSFNQLTNLNVSFNTELIDLNIANNQLTSLNVQNGNNVNFTLFNAVINPNLTCIQVDNVAFSNANWNNIDGVASFSTNCGVTSVSDIDESTIIQLYPNPANNHLSIALGSSYKNVEVTITNITGKVIYTTTESDMQKIEVNTEDFAKGIYFVKILSKESFGQSADFIATKKLAIEK